MEQHASFIEQNWPLTNVRVGDSLKEAAGIRVVRRLEANEGTFICKVADRYKTTAELDHSLLAFDLLPKVGFTHIPSLLETTEGKLYQEHNGQYTYILEYIGGKNPGPTPASYAKLGLITAQLHVVKDYPYETAFQPATIIANDLVALLEDQPFNDDYLKLVKSLPKFDGLPQALIHTDIAPINAIERPNGEVVLIDWDDVGMGIRVLDIAFPLIQQFISEDREYDEESARAFYGAYLSKISLTSTELSHVFPAALFIALMYIIYGDTHKRWKRIQWAITNREMLERNLTI